MDNCGFFKPNINYRRSISASDDDPLAQHADPDVSEIPCQLMVGGPQGRKNTYKSKLGLNPHKGLAKVLRSLHIP